MTGNIMHHEYQPDSLRVLGRGVWQDEDTFVMEWRFIETALCDFVTCRFTGNNLTSNGNSRASRVRRPVWSRWPNGPPQTWRRSRWPVRAAPIAATASLPTRVMPAPCGPRSRARRLGSSRGRPNYHHSPEDCRPSCPTSLAQCGTSRRRDAAFILHRAWHSTHESTPVAAMTPRYGLGPDGLGARDLPRGSPRGGSQVLGPEQICRPSAPPTEDRRLTGGWLIDNGACRRKKVFGSGPNRTRQMFRVQERLRD
jgi:hypothetical protein